MPENERVVPYPGSADHRRQAEEFYAYKDPHGNLVISNKLPPTGIIVLKRYELPQATDPQVQQPQEGSDTQQNAHSEDSAKPSKNK